MLRPLLLTSFFILSLLHLQSQTTWHLKVGIGSGSIVDYTSDLRWSNIKRFDLVDERFRFRPRPTIGLAFDKSISKNCSWGGDFNLLWHSFNYQGGYGSGFNSEAKFSLLCAQTSGMFTVQTLDWLSIRLGLSGVFRLGDFTNTHQTGSWEVNGQVQKITAKDIFRGIMIMPMAGLLYPGKKIGLELLAGHSLTAFPKQSSTDLRLLTTLQLALLFKL